MEYNYVHIKYKTNMICRFDGLCWDEEHRKGMNYEDYKNYIKDELNYHCGIVDEFLTEKIIQTLCKEMII